MKILIKRSLKIKNTLSHGCPIGFLKLGGALNTVFAEDGWLYVCVTFSHDWVFFFIMDY